MISGIEKVRGWSADEIRAALDKEGVQYKVELSRPNWDNYFQDTRIQFLNETPNPREIGRRLFGRPHHIGLGVTYYATYSILPEFDITQLDGTIKFESGRLVERTIIMPEKY